MVDLSRRSNKWVTAIDGEGLGLVLGRWQTSGVMSMYPYNQPEWVIVIGHVAYYNSDDFASIFHPFWGGC